MISLHEGLKFHRLPAVAWRGTAVLLATGLALSGSPSRQPQAATHSFLEPTPFSAGLPEAPSYMSIMIDHASIPAQNDVRLPITLSSTEADILRITLDQIQGGEAITSGIQVFRETRNTPVGGFVGGEPGETKISLFINPDFDQNRTYKYAEETNLQTEGAVLAHVFASLIGHNFSTKVAEQVGKETGQKMQLTREIHLAGKGRIGIFTYAPERDMYDPIYATYAIVDGWEYGRPEPFYFEGELVDGSAMPFIWHPKQPHSLDRKEYPNVSSEYDIEQAFADDFANFALRPQILSSKKRLYFDNIFRGLVRDPQKFVQEVADSPMILFEGAV